MATEIKKCSRCGLMLIGSRQYETSNYTVWIDAITLMAGSAICYRDPNGRTVHAHQPMENNDH